MVEISIHFEDKRYSIKAELLSQQLNLPINTDTPIFLQVTDKLSLIKKGCKPLSCDFHWQTWAKYRTQAKPMLINACKPKPGKSMIDATAGWGKDAALLATFGARVIMLERHPVMVALLEDGLARQTDVDRVHLNMSLVKANAIEYLDNLLLAHYPDVIYCDPMHPEREKSALVKNNMQLLQAVIGCEEDASLLLDVAQKRVRDKVVMKWPVSQLPLQKPMHSYTGKTVRYDVYPSHDRKGV